MAKLVVQENWKLSLGQAQLVESVDMLSGSFFVCLFVFLKLYQESNTFCLFIWLCQILVVARRIFIVSYEVFSCCTLACGLSICGMWA